MRKPTDNLDSFFGNAAPEFERPPRRVSLISMRKFEVVKPLATYEAPPKRKAAVSDPSLRHFPLGRPAPSYPSFAMGAAFAVIILVLASAVLIGINEPAAELADGSIDFAVDQADSSTDLAVDASDSEADQVVPDNTIPDAEASASEIRSAGAIRNRLRSFRSAVRSRHVKPAPRVVAYRPRRPRPRLVQVTDIVPTTLVIYPEDGEIKTRIEFQVSGLYKKPLEDAPESRCRRASTSNSNE
jgi:hypothetical protein